MDLVLSTFSNDELDQMPQFKGLLEKLKGKLDENGRLKANAIKSAKLQRDVDTARSKYIERLILYRCLQAIAAGDVEDGCDLPDEVQTTVADLLTASEWNVLKKSSQNKAVCLDRRDSTKAQLQTELDNIVAECISAKLENMVAKLIELSGEDDKKAFEKRIEKIRASRDEIASLERTRCKLIIAYQTTLLDYLQKLSKYCDEFVYTGELQLHKSNVDWLLMRTDALLLKAEVLELKIYCARYTKERVEKLKAVRNQQSQLQAELESQIGISREQLQAYEGIAGPDYNQLVKEYGRILDEIEDHKWALQQASTDND